MCPRCNHVTTIGVMIILLCPEIVLFINFQKSSKVDIDKVG